MQMNLRKRLAAIAGIWAIGTIVYAAYIIRSILAGPRSGDAYAYTLSYQLVMFVFYRLPPLLMLLASVCALEIARCHAQRARSSSLLRVVVAVDAVGLVVLGIVLVARGMAMGGSGPYSYSLEFNLLSFFRLPLPLATAVLVVPILMLSATAQSQPSTPISATGAKSDQAS